MSYIFTGSQTTGLVGIKPGRAKLVSSDNLATITTAGYINNSGANAGSLLSTDFIDVLYSYDPASGTGKFGVFTPTFSNGIITLVSYVPVGMMTSYDITLSASALASSGHVTIVPAMTGQQYVVRDIKVNYASAGLSGGGGNRLVTVTDGTTVYNNAGITAALLGTPVNTLWGGSGNPVAGTVAQNTPTVAGAALYAVYSGGTTDYTTGSVVISVTVQRTA